VVVLIVAVIITVNVTSPKKYEQSKSYIHFAQDGDSVTVIPVGKTRFTIDGYITSVTRSLDGSAAVIIVNEQSSWGGRTEDNLLYFITDRAQLVSDGVLSAWFSASGNAVVYSKEYDSSSGTAELWHYSGGSQTRISNDYSAYSNCAVSPNGKAVVFSTRNNDREIGYLWNGRLNELGRDIFPIAVSNDARYIYFGRGGAFFVQKGTNNDNRERLGDVNDINYLFANRDLSQVIYNVGPRAFISSKGGERVSLSDAVSSFLTPDGTGAMYHDSSMVIYDISDFADTFYLNRDGNIIRIDSRFETSNVARTSGYVSLANDGRTLTFLRNRSIYRVNGLRQSEDATEIVGGDVVSFAATSDGNSVFYVNDINEVFYQSGTRRPVTVSNHITGTGYGSYQFSLFQGKTLFYISDDELFSSTGDKGQVIRGLDGRVTGVFANAFIVQARVLDRGDQLTYISEDGKTFTQID